MQPTRAPARGTSRNKNQRNQEAGEGVASYLQGGGGIMYSVAKDWSPDGVARRGLCAAGKGAFSAPPRGSNILPLLN